MKFINMKLSLKTFQLNNVDGERGILSIQSNFNKTLTKIYKRKNTDFND